MTSVGAIATASSGVATFPVVVTVLGDPAGFNAGAGATVAIVYNELKNVIEVPSFAVTTANGVSTVTVEAADGKKSTRTVTTGLTANAEIQITSGLKAGENVVIALPGGIGGPHSAAGTVRTGTGGTGTGGFGGGGRWHRARRMGTGTEWWRAEHSRETPAPAPAVIDLAGVSKTYRNGSLSVEALRNVTMTIGQGEFVAISGPSGSGKSTLMHIIGCLDTPTGGTYRLAGQDVGAMNENQLAEVRNRRIGFVFQQFNLLSSMTAWRNVELPLLYSGVDRAERRQRAHDALAKVGLADRADHKPGELSGGQQQRVAVAQALVTEPNLILADEPTGNLDSTSTADVLALLDELHNSGRTIVLITHELDVAQRAGRIVRVRDGEIDLREPALQGSHSMLQGNEP